MKLPKISKGGAQIFFGGKSSKFMFFTLATTYITKVRIILSITCSGLSLEFFVAGGGGVTMRVFNWSNPFHELESVCMFTVYTVCRKVKLSICLLGISACVAQTITITNKWLLLLLCGLHSQQISSKQTLSLTFLVCMFTVYTTDLKMVNLQ